MFLTILLWIIGIALAIVLLPVIVIVAYITIIMFGAIIIWLVCIPIDLISKILDKFF